MPESLLSFNSSHKKCGEIFYNNATDFNVVCSFCSSNVLLEKFALHCRIQHLTLDEETISIEELTRNNKDKLGKDESLQYNITIIQQDPKHDPINPNEPSAVKTEEQVDISLEEEIPTEFNAIKGNAADEENDDDDEYDDNKTILQLIREKSAKTKTAKKIAKKTRPKRGTKKSANSKQLDDSKTKSEVVEVEKVSKEPHNTIEDSDWTMDDKFSTDDEENDTEIEKNDETKENFCNICNRGYASKRSLQMHNYSVHNSKRKRKPKKVHQCQECNAIVRSEKELKSHMWTHTEIVCDVCGRKFTQVGTLKRHKIRHTGIKDHKCKECSKEFFTAKELKSHLVCHTGFYSAICELCGKRCRDRGVLKAHMRRHMGERPAKCEVCGKCFYDGYDLNVHAVTHTNERPFACDICNSTFQRKKALRLHKRIHDKDQKYKCKICERGFVTSGGLNSHMRTVHNAAGEDCSSPQPLVVNKSAPEYHQIILDTDGLLLATYIV